MNEGLEPVYLIDYSYTGTQLSNVKVQFLWNANGYRLPTEAEWEYSARSGGKNEKWAGTSDVAALIDFAWYTANPNVHSKETRITHPVGQKRPNGLGLFDMTGNVSEWVWDLFEANVFYGTEVYTNPRGYDNPGGAHLPRIYRGGDDDTGQDVRASWRGDSLPDRSVAHRGFRIARSEVQPSVWGPNENRMNWSSAEASGRNKGMRLPTLAELQQGVKDQDANDLFWHEAYWSSDLENDKVWVCGRSGSKKLSGKKEWQTEAFRCHKP
ncbi:MAG: formylglycine-generating enzyme family protein [Leptospirales bacterium]|nr:formylglycine-generating enzyme family protein [Leptospirales bacterium]